MPLHIPTVTGLGEQKDMYRFDSIIGCSKAQEHTRFWRSPCMREMLVDRVAQCDMTIPFNYHKVVTFTVELCFQDSLLCGFQERKSHLEMGLEQLQCSYGEFYIDSLPCCF